MVFFYFASDDLKEIGLGSLAAKRRETLKEGQKMKNIAVVGATGAVGVEMLEVLQRRNFPVGKLSLLASERSAGKVLRFFGEDVPVAVLGRDSFKGVDIALFSAGSAISKQLVPVAVEAGCIVIDNSSTFRLDNRVPLVIPEINSSDVRLHRGIIANPNCTTAITLMALYPLHCAFGCKRIFATSYQAVSGTGAKAVKELEEQLKAYNYGEKLRADVYPHQIAFNVLPQVGSFRECGYTDEEMKMQNEGRKIMHHPTLRVSMTCARVPVFRSHSVAVSAEFKKRVTVEAAKEVLGKAAGLDVLDNPAGNGYPMPLIQSGKDNCAVGRIRKDRAFSNGLSFWVCGDQLLKGAALNAVQIAELLCGS